MVFHFEGQEYHFVHIRKFSLKGSIGNRSIKHINSSFKDIVVLVLHNNFRFELFIYMTETLDCVCAYYCIEWKICKL